MIVFNAIKRCQLPHFTQFFQKAKMEATLAPTRGYQNALGSKATKSDCCICDQYKCDQRRTCISDGAGSKSIQTIARTICENDPSKNHVLLVQDLLFPNGMARVRLRRSRVAWECAAFPRRCRRGATELFICPSRGLVGDDPNFGR